MTNIMRAMTGDCHRSKLGRSRGKERAMGSAAVDRLWQDFARTWSSHDMDQVLPLYTDDCIYEDVTLGAVNHGKEELRDFGQLFISASPTSRLK